MRHAPWQLNRYQVWHGGDPKSLKTPYEITYKKPYTSVNFAFGEPLMARVVQRLQHFAKLEPRWVPGFSFGRSADSDEFMVALVDGSKRVVVTRDAQPISLQQFPDQSLWSSWFCLQPADRLILDWRKGLEKSQVVLRLGQMFRLLLPQELI